MPQIGSVIVCDYPILINIPKPDITSGSIGLLTGLIAFLKNTIHNPSVEISDGSPFFSEGIGIALKLGASYRIARTKRNQFVFDGGDIPVHRPSKISGEFSVAYGKLKPFIADVPHIGHRGTVITQG